LEELNLSGNKLGNEGVVQVLKGLAVAKSIKKVYLSDNGWSSDSIDVMEALLDCMVKNKVLVRYDLQYNVMTDEGVLKIVEFLGQAPHVCEISIAEFVSEETLLAFRDAIAANKPKKGKKGKGKKKK
jgi:Ran GTPase-activating protein (RanGAP) involved in mRNA processing and transport